MKRALVFDFHLLTPPCSPEKGAYRGHVNDCLILPPSPPESEISLPESQAPAPPTPPTSVTSATEIESSDTHPDLDLGLGLLAIPVAQKLDPILLPSPPESQAQAPRTPPTPATEIQSSDTPPDLDLGLGLVAIPVAQKLDPILPASPPESKISLPEPWAPTPPTPPTSSTEIQSSEIIPVLELGLGLVATPVSKNLVDCCDPIKRTPYYSPPIDWEAFQFPAVPNVDEIEFATEEPLVIEPLSTKVSFILPEAPKTGFAIPLRRSGSPLRPSQYAARGGSTSPLRTPTRQSDRFIPQRRPEISTRESFHFSRATPADTTNADPFSPTLRRSRRVNEELRTLRQNHSSMMARTRSRGRPGLRSTSIGVNRQVSAGAVWNVGGSSAATDTVVGVTNGRGGLLASGTNAPLYTTMFITGSDAAAELDTYEQRLALAFDVDRSDKTLNIVLPNAFGHPTSHEAVSNGQSSRTTPHVKHTWNDSAWMREGSTTLLDAPQLRDDYYCSVLSYHHRTKILAVALGNVVHLWTEKNGVGIPDNLNNVIHQVDPTGYITSLAFAPASHHAILAAGRSDGRISLWSPWDPIVRYNAQQARPISCMSWRPTAVKLPSTRNPERIVKTHELLIGDEKGDIFIYTVEWPDWDDVVVEWIGNLKLLVHVEVHKQQICGLAWSANGEYFATGGNDNACFLFKTRNILRDVRRNQDGTYRSDTRDIIHRQRNGDLQQMQRTGRGRGSAIELGEGHHEHRWELNAAVKAIAFCPWLSCLLAIGGGSNDRCIHFYHTISGASIAAIDTSAQVTSLVWSTTRREIAATFGFAQPEHPYRIAVFSWPACEQIVSIPWEDESRALLAIAYPGGPSDEYTRHHDERHRSRTKQEGSLIIAGSDGAIRFHEVWPEKRRGRKPKEPMGLLGGSDILEDMAGIEKDWGEQIR
ncbi:WD40 repeat-like protein [Mytilinidion resinicola]|uniref:WD40 repeat-like protein n=1 Tax=Mytilinidion resinicola TaxID=574789 RepID=A0A6A6YJM5_9PEZI|nr:WD40 repeat-like protein [Mytilinidion resinicola]KAF2808758.1 WD40 repeat-like protein [Mytilinidion resinicola]